MENFDFDDIFSEKMQQAGTPDMSDYDWATLSQRLDTYEKRRRYAVPFWWIGGLGALLLLSNLGWWAMWQRTSSQLDGISAALAKEVVVQTDTTFKKIVVYQYDTVYRTMVYQSSQSPFSSFQNNALGSKFAAESPAFSAAPDKLTSVSSPNDLANTSVDNTNTANNTISFLPGLPFDSLYSIRAISPEYPDLLIVQASKAKKSLLLHPTTIRVGAGGGSLTAVAPALSQGSGGGGGVKVEADLTRHITVAANADWNGIRIAGNQLDENLGLPEPSLPGDEYDFLSFAPHEGYKSVFHLGLATQWNFRPHRLLNPYINAGILAQWNPSFEVEMVYRNLLTGKNRSMESHTLRLPVVPYFQTGLGFRLELLRNWTLGLGGDAYFKLSQNRKGIPLYYGIRSNIFYTF